MSLQLGATMLLVGPILNFTFVKGKSKNVFLAQGIGITPFRSMLAYARSTDMPVDTTLVHVDGKGHLFRELTEQAASSAFYPMDSEEFQTIVKQQDASSLFYISGSPRFVTATKQLLSEMNVDRRNIKTDSFLGY